MLSRRPLDGLGIGLERLDLSLDALVLDLQGRRLGDRLGVLGPGGLELRAHLAVIRETYGRRREEDHHEQTVHDSVSSNIT